MRLSTTAFADGAPIPAEFAFGAIDAATHVKLSANRNPDFAWSVLPAGTQSLALVCHDPDVPSRGDDVNKEGRHVPASLPRVEFFHWIMVDIPLECRELGAGSCSEGVVAHGKQNPFGPPGAKQGINDYTGWFANDASMGGDYYGYDGPCPPWNDALLHHYHFKVYALDVASLPLVRGFSLAELRAAMVGHVLAEAELVGVYSLNPAVTG